MRTLVAFVLAIGALAAMPPRATAALIYGITFDNNLFSFDSSAPTNILSGVYVSGLQPNEFIQAIDFRPSTNVLYALGSTNRIYTLNLTTGAATAVGAPFSPALSGTAFGMDFDPVADRIRVVSDTDQNLRIDPTTGAVASVDTNLAYGPGPYAGVNPSIVGAAYTNNVPGANATTLFVVDCVLDVLAIQNPPNDGALTVVGTLGHDVINYLAGFDIESSTGVAYLVAAGGGGGRSWLFTVNLATGLTVAEGVVGGGLNVRAIAIPIPEPTTLAAAGLAVMGLAVRRRGVQ
ncbi:DUF4394 domain-containing protein [Fontivita pretiosa]|uniref:DUF4394 domain-containing protein n=1 Tax=Fontivita pretiosa TaxID=2989684 RepID=UPI003D1792F8